MADTPTAAEHGPVFRDWMAPAPTSCKCGSDVTKDGNYYVCKDSGYFLG